MDIALQRPIIVTSSKEDKTIRVWNYLTGHCEYCKIILTEKEELDQEIDILSVAIHPNGYYMAVSDSEMIRFFHLCYKELRYYNNDSMGSGSSKKNCTILKFSNGGHLLAAVSGKTIYIIKSYTRELLREFKTPHTSTVKSIIWEENDNYLYSIGAGGIVVEYNIFSFKMDEISTKSINYSNGCLFNFSTKKNNSLQLPNELLACGLYGSKPIISQIILKENIETQVCIVVFIEDEYS
jgi:WD40 repeat protein